MKACIYKQREFKMLLVVKMKKDLIQPTGCTC